MQTLSDLKQEKIRLCRAGYNAADLVVTIQVAAVCPNTGDLIEGEFWLSKKDTEILDLFNNLAARLIAERNMKLETYKAEQLAAKKRKQGKI